MASKSDIVAKWFVERLNSGSQIADNSFALKHNLLAEKAAGGDWYSRIDTDVIYDDFLRWANKEYGPSFVYTLDLTKAGFMLIFYRATGATRGRTRFGLVRGKTSYVAIFRDQKYHDEHFEQYILKAA